MVEGDEEVGGEVGEAGDGSGEEEGDEEDFFSEQEGIGFMLGGEE